MRATRVTMDTARERRNIYRVGQATADVFNATPCLKASQVQVCSTGAFRMHISASMAFRMRVSATLRSERTLVHFVRPERHSVRLVRPEPGGNRVGA